MSADWVGLNEKITGLIGSAGGSRGSGSLWKTFDTQLTADKNQVAEQGHKYNNYDDLVDYVDNKGKAAQQSYDSFLSTWQSNFARDAEYMYSLHSIAVDTWQRKVAHPLRHASHDTRDSKLLGSWSGPGAEKYAGALTKQAAAMDEIQTMMQTAGSAINAALNNIQGICLATYNYSSKVKDQLSGWQTDPGKDGFGVRATYGAAVFKSLNEWISKLADYGDWIANMQTHSDALDDALVNTTSFAAGHWPKAVLRDLKMTNGNSGLGDRTKQAGGPGSQTGAPDPTTGGAQGGPVGGPDQVDPGDAHGKQGGQESPSESLGEQSKHHKV